MSEPIVSFVIPTFNRSKYCISQIKSFGKIKGDFEVVISDNSTDKLLFDFINKNGVNYKIKYYYTEENLDMTQNLNRAISFARGEYLCCLGDDDIIMPDCIDYINEFKKKKINIISPNISINYCWPDFSSKYFDNAHKSRLYYLYSKPYIKKKNSKNAFKKAIEKCFQGTVNMPKLYHGFVNRNIFEKIKLETGNYLFGSSPDISASILLSLNSEYYYETNIPLTIPGASSSSNTGRAAKKNHIGKLEDENQTKHYIKSWPKLLPKLFTVETVWAHSAFISLEKMKISYQDFDYLKLYSLIIVNNISSFRQVLNQLPKLKFLEIFKLSLNLIYELNKKIIYLIQRGLIPTAAGGRKFKSEIKNLEEVINACKEIKKIKNFNYLKCSLKISKL